MKLKCLIRLAVAMSCCLAVLTVAAGPSAAAGSPRIFEQGRAIPTKSGMNVKLVVFTKRLRTVKLRINGETARKARRYGKGCGRLRCQKWKIYSVRSDNECYDVRIIGRGARGARATMNHTICEPFPGGTV